MTQASGPLQSDSFLLVSKRHTHHVVVLCGVEGSSSKTCELCAAKGAGGKGVSGCSSPLAWTGCCGFGAWRLGAESAEALGLGERKIGSDGTPSGKPKPAKNPAI